MQPKSIIFIILIAGFIGHSRPHLQSSSPLSAYTTSFNQRTGNLLIGRENHLHASSTCGLKGPERYCSKDRRCYTCDSRFSPNSTNPMFPKLYHGIRNAIKRRRYDQRQNNITYERLYLDALLNESSTNVTSSNNQSSVGGPVSSNLLDDNNNTLTTSSPEESTTIGSSNRSNGSYLSHGWWQAENGAENITIQLDLENEFLFTHLIMHFNSFYPAEASIERSLDFGRTWHVYQYYATDCHLSYPWVEKGPKRRVNETVCENLPSLEPSDDGELVMKVLAPTPAYVADKERTIVEALANISTFTKELLDEYEELKQMMRVTNLRINLIKLQTLGDELYGQFRDENGLQDEQIKEIYHFGLNDLFVYGSCSCNGHSNRCVKNAPKYRQPFSTSEFFVGPIGGRSISLSAAAAAGAESTLGDHSFDANSYVIDDSGGSGIDSDQTQAAMANNTSIKAEAHERHDDEDMIYGYCQCEHHTQGANCHQCQDLYNDWPWRPAGPQQASECKKCQCNGLADKCQFDMALFRQSNSTSGGFCLDCSKNTRGSRCHLCRLGYFRRLPIDGQSAQQQPQQLDDQSGNIGSVSAGEGQIGIPCQACQCNRTGTQDGVSFCHQGRAYDPDDLSTELEPDHRVIENEFYSRLVARFLVNQTIHSVNLDEGPKMFTNTDWNQLELGQCLCKQQVAGLQCDRCAPGAFGYNTHPRDGCQRCPCNLFGTITDTKDICDPETGQCRCRESSIGFKCDQCKSGYYGILTTDAITNTTGITNNNVNAGNIMKKIKNGTKLELGCKPCDCNAEGSLDTECDPISGQCKCKENTYGRRCDQCQDGFWSYPDCKPCTCNGHANLCDQISGECLECKNSTTGPYCDECQPGYFGQPILGPEAIESSHKKSITSHNITSLVYSACSPCACPGLGPQSSEFNAISCHPVTGECQCKPNFGGRRCNECGSGQWGDLKSRSGCRKCGCNMLGAISNDCDKTSGFCICRTGMSGRKCEQCGPGYHPKYNKRQQLRENKQMILAVASDSSDFDNTGNSTTILAKNLTGGNHNWIASPETCVPCGECYDQWKIKVDQIYEETQRLSLQYRKSLSLSRSRKATLSEGVTEENEVSYLVVPKVMTTSTTTATTIATQTNATCANSTTTSSMSISDKERDIEEKLQLIASVINSQKLAKDRFTNEQLEQEEISRLYDETLNRQLTIRTQLESEAYNLMNEIENVEFIKELLFRMMDDLDEERRFIQRRLLKETGQPRTSWKTNINRAQQLYDGNLALYQSIDAIYIEYRQVLANTTALYEAATSDIEGSLSRGYNTNYRDRLAQFSIRLPVSSFMRILHHDSSSSPSNKVMLINHEKTIARITSKTTTNVTMNKKDDDDKGTAVMPDITELLWKRYEPELGGKLLLEQLQGSYVNNYQVTTVTDNDSTILNNGTLVCNLSNWRQCSWELKLLQRRLPMPLESARSLVYNYTHTITKKIKSIDQNELPELGLMEIVLLTHNSRTYQNLTDRLDDFMGRKLDQSYEFSLPLLHKLQNQSKVLYLDDVLHSMIGETVEQSNKLKNLTKSAEALLSLTPQLVASNLKEWIQMDTNGELAEKLMNDSDVRQAVGSLLLTWTTISKELEEELWPRYRRLVKDEIGRHNNQQTSSLLTTTITESTTKELATELNELTNEIHHNLEFSESVINESSSQFLASSKIKLIELEQRHNNILLLAANNLHSMELAEQIAQEANYFLEMGDHQGEEEEDLKGAPRALKDPSQGLRVLMGLAESNWKLNRFSNLSQRAPTGSNSRLSVVGPSAKQMSLMTDIASQSDELYAKRWSNLRLEFKHFLGQVDLDASIMEEYVSLNNIWRGKISVYEEEIKRLQEESNQLENKIHEKWLYHELCHG